MGIEEPMLAQQYEDGQLKGAHGTWDDEDPHMTYAEFDERAMCHYRSLRRTMTADERARRKTIFDDLCKQYPRYWKAFYNKHRKK